MLEVLLTQTPIPLVCRLEVHLHQRPRREALAERPCYLYTVEEGVSWVEMKTDRRQAKPCDDT